MTKPHTSITLMRGNLLNFMVSNIPYDKSLVNVITEFVLYLDQEHLGAPEERVVEITQEDVNHDYQEITFKFKNLNGYLYKDILEIYARYEYVSWTLVFGGNQFSFSKIIPNPKKDTAPKAQDYNMTMSILKTIAQSTDQCDAWTKSTAKILLALCTEATQVTCEKSSTGSNLTFTVKGTGQEISNLKSFFDALDDTDVHAVVYPDSQTLVINKKELMLLPAESQKVIDDLEAPKKIARKRRVPSIIEIVKNLKQNSERVVLTKSMAQDIEIVEMRENSIWIHRKNKDAIEFNIEDPEIKLKTYKRINRFLKDHLV
jgi:hypothetical protein